MENENRIKQIYCVASGSSDIAQERKKAIIEKYGSTKKPKEADVIVAIGGDGFMLHVIRKYGYAKLPIYGINQGNVGFLLNECSESDDILEKINKSFYAKFFCLCLQTTDINGVKKKFSAINDISILRSSSQALKMQITVNSIPRIESAICDGILVSTPFGSTAYNLAAGGPILPLSSNLISIRPLSMFRPRNWNGAILDAKSHITIELEDASKRTGRLSIDSQDLPNIKSIKISRDKYHFFSILFDQHPNERIIQEQFCVQ